LVDLVGVGEDLVFVQNCLVWVVVVVVVVVVVAVAAVGGGMLYCWAVVVVDDFEIVVVAAAVEVVAAEVAVAVEVLVSLLMEQRYLEVCAAFETMIGLVCLWMRTELEVDGMKTQLSGVTRVVVGCRCLVPDTVVTAIVEAVEMTVAVVVVVVAVLVVAVDESVGAAAVATNAGELLMVVGVEELERGETAGAY
jgi:hypothetical protein